MHMPLMPFICGHSRAVDPTSSLARGPPIDEDLKRARCWEASPTLAPWAKNSLWLMVLPSDGSSASVFMY